MDYGCWLVWIMLHAVVFCAGEKNVKVIWCLSDNVKDQRFLIKDINVEDMLCQAKSTTEYPWTVTPEETPPPPESMSTEPHVYKTSIRNPSQQIAVYVSWIYRRDYFLKYVTSYHMEINLLKPSGWPKQYLMTWNGNLTSVLKNTSAATVEFRFIYSGRPDNYHIHPNDKYRFKIQACPIYGEDDNAQYVENFTIIPGCNDEQIFKTEFCCPHGRRKNGKCRRARGKPKLKKSKRPPKNLTTTPPLTEEEDFSAAGPVINANVKHIVFIVIGGILILVIIGIAVCAYRRGKCCCFSKKAQPGQIRRQLLLIASTDDRFLQPINQLISTLSKSDCIDLTCNLRQKVEIGNQGILKWMTKNVNDADIVIFLIANPQEAVAEKEDDENSRLDDIERHQVGMALRVLENIITNKAVDGKKKIIAFDLNSCIKSNTLPLFECYKLPNDFKKFLKSILGNDLHHIPDNDKTIFLNLLSNAQLGYCSKVTTSDDIDNEKVEEKFIPEGQNNLDLSPYPSLTNATDEGYSDSLNITPDGPPSCESNHSQKYVTTDFNNDPDQFERYRHAGARPKVTC